MWFTRTTAGNIARINAAGVITAESKAVRGSEPFGITVASNGNPWFTMLSANKIATLPGRGALSYSGGIPSPQPGYK
jgi:streptogramin lyase